MSGTMAAQSSLYNEDRNLLRIREKERRNQEAQQEKECFLENAPLFAEPYKTKKGDELSSRIQRMLGKYEEVKELISTKDHRNLFGIPKSTAPFPLQSKSDRTLLSNKAGNMSQSTYHQPMGPPTCAPSSGNSSGQHRKAYPGKDQASAFHSKSLPASRSQSRSQGQSHCDQDGRDGRSRHNPKKHVRHVDSNSCTEEELSSPSRLSPLLSSLSSPVELLSPIHSSHHRSPRIQNNKSHGSVHTHSTKPPLNMESSDNEARDNAISTNLTLPSEPPTQTFPTPLSSKMTSMQQKPTAYVRPMDGQDQAPSKSPELKPLTEDYHGQSYGNIANLKVNSKLSKLKISSEPIEQTLSSEAQCVEDILKEMTHSWPPPLTAINTPSTIEPSKFSFPTKESHHISTVKKSQKQYDITSVTSPNSKLEPSRLEDDLEISDSEDSEPDQVSENAPLFSAPPSALQSKPNGVTSAHSNSAESESTSESDTSSDSESESNSSDSEVNKPPRASTPKPDPPTSNSWQLNNFLKGSQPTTLSDHPTEEDHDQQNQLEVRQEDKSICSSSKPSEPKDPVVQKPPRTNQEGHHQNKKSCQKSPAVKSEEQAPRQTVGTKQPRKPSKILVQEPPKGGLQVESEPVPYVTKEQPSKEKPKVKTKVKMTDTKDSIQTDLLLSEKKKHKSSHQSTNKASSDCGPDQMHVARIRVELSDGHQSHKQSTAHNRTSDSKSTVVIHEEVDRDKVALSSRENSLSLPKMNQASDALIVKIELSLLSRIPQKNSHQKKKKVESNEVLIKAKQDSDKKNSATSVKTAQKRKGDEELKSSESKKLKVEKDLKATSTCILKETSKPKCKPSSECLKKERLIPAPMSPTPNSQKPSNTAHKRQNSGSNPCNQDNAERRCSTPVKTKGSHKDPTPPKHIKVEGKSLGVTKSNNVSMEPNTSPFPVPSLPNGNPKALRPHLKFDAKTFPAEHYVKEAKRLKHKADVMSDKVGKAFNYLDAAMFFIECGTTMKPDATAPTSPYNMFAETVDLIKFIMNSKNFTDAKSSSIEEIFSVMCMRCQSLLYLMMFRHKKDTAIKYSRTLSEHFKSTSRAAQAPSPCVARSTTGTPSPLSQTPSPASLGGSQPASNASSMSSGLNNTSVSIPLVIQQIASSYVNITSYFVQAYEIWEKADKLTTKNKEFFAELNTVVCPLALNSSMTELVRYTRQGLHWLRLESSAP